MQVGFLLGPAGSGKTFRCLTEVRAALAASPDGLPLVFLAPKQATFQLERELLADPALAGYTRLQILSFDRLAEYVLNQFFSAPPRLLSDEGRVMVLRALLARNYSRLRLFHATARLPGFAQQLSRLLNEFQQHQLSPERLTKLAADECPTPQLQDKLHDLSLLLRAYLEWLEENDLQDPNGRLELAAATVAAASRDAQFRLGGLWLDGFAELTPQELGLLAAMVPACERTTLAFCLDCKPEMGDEWHSMWATTGRTFRRCHQRLEGLPGFKSEIEILDRHAIRSRFANSPALAHLERHWVLPRPFQETTLAGQSLVLSASASPETTPGIAKAGLEARAKGAGVAGSRTSLRLLACPDPETEAMMAARELLQHVRAGARFREAAVLVRSLPGYERVLARVFNRYGIPFFIDRREPLSHHPLAELTRYALRILVSNWEHDDWFGALKTGLVHSDDAALDRLENIALARGWRGSIWLKPLLLPKEPELEQSLERLRRAITLPFSRLAEALDVVNRQPNGVELAAAIRALWDDLEVAETIQGWVKAAAPPGASPASSSLQAEIHAQAGPVIEQWLDNLELAFEKTRLPLGDWLAIVDSGLAGLTAGVIPPALDEVLIGQVDRSRNPNLEVVLLLGLNETVFPAVPPPPVLLSEYDRDALMALGLTLGLNPHDQIGQERLLGYIACTRARQRVVLSYSHRDLNGKPLNPSPFVYHLQRLFPGLEVEQAAAAPDWRESLHPNELVVPLLKNRLQTGSLPPGATVSGSLTRLERLPLFAPVMARWDQVASARSIKCLSPGLADKVYGEELKTSISNLEDYAACPFKFFVVRGLRAQERAEFEVDRRERGSFQHEILMEFHRRLQAQGKRWRDLSPQEAARFLGQIGADVSKIFRDGLFESTPDRKFAGRTLIEGLQKLISVLVQWAPQYRFEPQTVEMAFGMEEGGLKPWEIDLGKGHRLVLRGRIDRVDMLRQPNGDAFVVVIDYKSSGQELEQVRLVNGLDLQLLAYLGVLRDSPNAGAIFGASKLIPAGAFYVSLRGQTRPSPTRSEVLETAGTARPAGYQHRGRFRADLLGDFDSRERSKGDQFRYSRNKDGAFSKLANEVLPEGEFLALVDQIEQFLRQYGQEIYAGDVRVAPCRQKAEIACAHCDYRSICRFDPWVDPYRVLKAEGRPKV